MPAKTVAFNSRAVAGRSDLVLILIDPRTGAIGNGSGDTLIPGVKGRFTAVVDEAITGLWEVQVENLSGDAVLENGKVYFPGDVAGTYIVDDPLAPIGTIGIQQVAV